MAEKENLKGKVKRVHTINGKDFVTLHFDEDGRLTKKETPYMVYGNYVYGNGNRLMSYDIYDTPDKASKYLFTHKMEYDKHGFLISDGRTSYKNDRRGNCIKEEGNNLKVKRIYNKKNQVVEAFSYDDKPHTIHSWGEDENNGYFERDDVIPPYEDEHVFYAYNEHGDVISRTVKTNVPPVDVITYTYDAKGNWIEKHHTEPHLTIVELKGITCGENVTRTIEYYE